MNKKTKKIILGVSALVLIGASIAGAGVFAKYVASTRAGYAMNVAKWDTTVHDAILSNTTYTAGTLTNGKLAPGTEGSLLIDFDIGNNETGVDYFIKLANVQNKPTNLYFVVDGIEYRTLDEITTVLSGHVNAGEGNRTINKVVQWKWDYETGDTDEEIAANDTIDTNEGKLAQSMTFDVIVSATQTRPEN